MKSKKLLNSFTRFCDKNRELRFWQALVAWSGYNYIYGSKSSSTDEGLEDTFYKTGINTNIKLDEKILSPTNTLPSLKEAVLMKMAEATDDLLSKLIRDNNIVNPVYDITIIHWMPNDTDYIKYKNVVFKQVIKITEGEVTFSIIRVNKLGD